jgi:CheY-like chemotaxis protein
MRAGSTYPGHRMKRLPQVEKILRDSDPPESISVPRDLSERAPMASVAELAATIAHDVNNPLAVVAANLDFLAEVVAALRMAPASSTPAQAAAGLAQRLDEADVCLRDAGEAVDRLRGVVTYVKEYVSPRVSPPVPGAGVTETAPPGSITQRNLIRRVRMLVVDDDEIVARALQRTLRGYEVTVTLSALEALDLVSRGERFDVILCDVMMPRMTGYELYEELSRAAPDQAERIIFVTGGGTTKAARDFLGAVTNPVVDKPFDVGKLRELIRRRMR